MLPFGTAAAICLLLFESFEFQFSLDGRVTDDTVKPDEMEEEEEEEKGRLMKVQEAQTCCLLCPI